MNEENVKEETVEKTESRPEKKREKKKEIKEVHFCKDCRSYDWTTEREFHRDGIREGLVEIRAVCRNPKSRAYRHLVMAQYSKRQCSVWEKGVYEKPLQEKKHKEESVKNEAAKESFKKTSKQSLR